MLRKIPKTHSGKFVLRVGPQLHQELIHRARQKDQSLNQACVESILQGLEHPSTVQIEESYQYETDIQTIVGSLLKAKTPILGVVLFGSVARGEARESSDIDLLIPVSKNIPLSREFYQTWDKVIQLTSYSPQFVHIPDTVMEAGSLWYETAIDGIVLWEKDFEISKFLSKIRSAIVEGKLKRSMTHGHSYWTKYAK